MATDEGELSKENKMSVLLADYQTARYDSRSIQQTLATFISIGIAMLTVYAAALSRTCHVPSGSTANRYGLGDCRAHAIPWVYALTPLFAVSVLGVVALAGAVAAQRSYYIRELELQIAEATNLGQGANGEVSGLIVPSFEHLEARFLSQKRGPLENRLIFGMLYSSIALLAGGSTFFSLYLTRPIDLQIIAGIGYLLIGIALLRIVWFGSFASERYWPRLVKSLPLEHARTQARRTLRSTRGIRETRSRSFASYLLLPRPAELAIKAWFVVAATLFGGIVLNHRPTSHVVAVAIELFVIFEFLGYQGRYLLNDLRGSLADTDHPQRGSTRLAAFLKGGNARSVAIWCASITLVRFAASVYMALRLQGWRVGKVTSLFVVLIFVIGFLYDGIRERTSARPPTGAASRRMMDLLRGDRQIVYIYLLVGIGYSCRVMLGLIEGSGGRLGVPALLMTAIAFWWFGVMFVTMTWAIDSLHFAELAEVAGRRCLRFDPAIFRFPHLPPLVEQWSRSLGVNVIFNETRPMHPGSRSVASISPISDASGLTWWNTAFLLAASFAGACGAALDRSSWKRVLLFGALAAAGAGTTILTRRWFVAFSIGMEVILACFKQVQLIAQVLPFDIVIVTYVAFRQMTLADIEFDPTLLLRLHIYPRIARLGQVAAGVALGSALQLFKRLPGDHH